MLTYILMWAGWVWALAATSAFAAQVNIGPSDKFGGKYQYHVCTNEGTGSAATSYPCKGTDATADTDPRVIENSNLRYWSAEIDWSVTDATTFSCEVRGAFVYSTTATEYTVFATITEASAGHVPFKVTPGRVMWITCLVTNPGTPGASDDVDIYLNGRHP